MVDDVDNRILVSDPLVMRALAHPARLAILEEMHGSRSGTATEFAEVCGLTPSATSYHLRALARAGLVEQAPGRGDGRERLWRRVGGGGLEVSSGPDADPETRRAEHELVSLFLGREEARARSWLARWPQETQEWYEATMIAQSLVLVTPQELAGLNRQIQDLLKPYAVARRADPPADARRVSVTYRTIPLPDRPDASEQPRPVDGPEAA